MNKASLKRSINEWILEMDKSSTLPSEIVALNFGLAEPYCIELIGAEVYDEEDGDWACEEDFIPENNYLNLEEISDNEGWQNVLNIVVTILKEIVEENRNLPLLQVKHIITGFCDGDLEIVK